MLLQRLREYADQRLELPPTLYSLSPVRYVIELDLDGRPTNPVPTDTADPSSPAPRRGQRRAMPRVERSPGGTPLLRADNAEFVCGLAREGSRPQRGAT